jgi:hypothetical protein
MFFQPATPNPIANVNAIATTIISNKNETAANMILQVPFDPNPLILIERLNKIQKVPFARD